MVSVDVEIYFWTFWEEKELKRENKILTSLIASYNLEVYMSTPQSARAEYHCLFLYFILHFASSLPSTKQGKHYPKNYLLC